MGKKSFTFPSDKSHAPGKDYDRGILKNKFSGKFLFRSEFYHLVTGNLTLLDKSDNACFIEQILDYSAATLDLNMLPALKKVTSGNIFEEGIRQRSSEIVEKIEDQIKRNRSDGTIAAVQREYDKINNARQALAGTRSPQTTEILRLLRDKSPELKKLALYLIGKFRMTDMIPEVCGCLAVPEVRIDAYNVLMSLGAESGKELSRFYLTSSGNIVTQKAILRLIGSVCTGENKDFLFEIIWSNLRQLKEIALKVLNNCGYKVESADRKRLEKLIFEIFGLLSWITNIKAGLIKINDHILGKEVDKEYNRWKGFLQELLNLTYGGLLPAISGGDENGVKDDFSKAIPELIKIVFGNLKTDSSDNKPDPKGDLKRRKKLQHYFPAELPLLRKLREDIINCDYNIIGIWTKACTVRHISEIDDEETAESVVALLFSPEEMLQQEAARSVARSGRELYRTTSERIPDSVRHKLDNIVTGVTEEPDLIFEKVKFLSSCFHGVSEAELVFLAEKMSYIKGLPDEIPYSEDGSILWCFPDDNPVPVVFVLHEKSEHNNLRWKMKTPCSYSYVLPLDAIEEFGFQYPESVFCVLIYIDNNEG